MRPIFIALLLITAVNASAQSTIPFKFVSEDENKLIKENDSLKFYAATDDTSAVVALNDDALWYKLLKKDRVTVLAEGAFITEGEKFLQDGKWVARYENGKIKVTGYFRKGKQIGTWMEYYNSGKPRTIYNYGIFTDKGEMSTGLSGTWQEFYSSGKLKVNGFYASNTVVYYDTLTVTDPVSGSEVRKAVKHRALNAEKTGHWEYFSEDGELDKKEDF